MRTDRHTAANIRLPQIFQTPLKFNILLISINSFVTDTRFVLCVVGKRFLFSWILVSNGQYGKQLQVNFGP